MKNVLFLQNPPKIETFCEKKKVQVSIRLFVFGHFAGVIHSLQVHFRLHGEIKSSCSTANIQ